LRPATIAGLVGSIGVLVGSILPWFDSPRLVWSAFDMPVALLFDYRTSAQNPKIGALLVVIAIIALVCSFLRRARWIALPCGVLAIAVPVLYQIQMSDALRHYGSATDVVGVGLWLTGSAGILLAISPLLRSRERPESR
jgi:hypothetical protein